MAAWGEESPSFELEEVVVTATKTPLRIKDAGANLSLITQAEISKMHYQNVADLLRHISGVNIIGYGGLSGQKTVFLNGTENVVVLVDGKKLNLPQGSGFGGAGVDLANLMEVDNIERIEVLKGPASSLYGADAVGGVINIITKRGQENKTTTDITAGSWGQEVYALTNQGKEDKLDWYLTYKKERADYFKTSNGVRVNNSGYTGESCTLRVDQDLGSKGNITYSYQYYQKTGGVPGKLENPSKESWANNTQNNWDITYNVQFSSKASGILKLFENNIHDYGYSSVYSDIRVKKQGVQLQSGLQVNNNHLLTVGIEWEKDRLVDKSDSASNIGEKANENLAFYLQDDCQISQRVNLNSGVRFDHHQAYGDSIMPRFMLTYKASPKTSYYLTRGRFFKAPNFNELYYPNVDFISYKAMGNPNLKPEKGWSTEVGLNHQFDNTLEGKLSYFYRNSKGAIQWEQVGEVIKPDNLNEQKAEGMELRLNKNFNPKLQGFLGYSYLLVQNKKNGEDFVKDPNAPNAIWDLGINYAEKKLNFTIKGKGIIGRRNPNFKPQNYWLWDTGLNIQVGEGKTAFLTVRNLFNQSYEEIDGMKGFWAGHYPSPGRNYSLGIKFQF